MDVFQQQWEIAILRRLLGGKRNGFSFLSTLLKTAASTNEEIIICLSKPTDDNQLRKGRWALADSEEYTMQHRGCSFPTMDVFETP